MNEMGRVGSIDHFIDSRLFLEKSIGIGMGQEHCLLHLLFALRVVQMAGAAAIAAPEAWHGFKPLANSPGDAALQIKIGFGDGLLPQFAAGQQIVDMPPSGAAFSSHNRCMSVQAPETARTPGRAGVGVEALWKMNPAQCADCNPLRTGQI